MNGVEFLKKFDHNQLWRFFVDGRFHKKYDGWVTYEAREPGSIQALINGFEYMFDRLYSVQTMSANHIRNLHRICMFNVQTNNIKSSPGEIRYQQSILPFFVKTTTLENIQEILDLRINDNRVIFSNKNINKPAKELKATDVFNELKKQGKLNYIAWYPVLDNTTQSFLNEQGTLVQFYNAKNHVQTLIAYEMELIVSQFNDAISMAKEKDEKLEAIALFIRELEILHPFSDGNCRVFACILLTQLLIRYGFPPSILKNPNLDAEVSLEQWIKEINRGFEYTLNLINNPNSNVYDYSIVQMSPLNLSKFKEMSKNLTHKINAYNEILLTPRVLSDYTRGTWINGDDSIRYTCVGNRGSYKKGCIYFAIGIDDWIKEKKDIRAELVKRVEAGVRGFVVDNDSLIHYIDIPVLLVEDVNKAFDDTARNIRIQSDVKTILVTGTEGKTGTKIQLHHLLSQQTPTHAVLNSANSEIPILSSLINLQKEHKLEINEVSVDANIEKTIMRSQTVQPNLCFFSNISTEHMHVHKTIANVIKAKSAVVEGLKKNGVCLINSSMKLYEDFAKAIQKRREDALIKTYGLDEQDDAFLLHKEFDTDKFGWNIKAMIGTTEVGYFLPLIQNHAPIMSIGALLAVQVLGYDVIQASKDYATLKPYESMGNIYKIPRGAGEFVFYDQSRRASISGVRSVFSDLKNFKVSGKIIALYGSISSVNDNEWTRAYHEELATLINTSKISKLYTTGPNLQSLHNNLSDNSILVENSDDYEHLYELIIKELMPGDLLIIQGYMRLDLDKIANKVILYKDESFYDQRIELYQLSDELLKKYKKLLYLKEKDNNTFSSKIKKLYKIKQSDYKEFSGDDQSYRQYRSELLFNWFQQVENCLKEDFSFSSVNTKLLEGNNKEYIYNLDFCNTWFNNIDKNKNEPRKHSFGSFFDFGSNKYLLFLLVGTTNLHIGICKYHNAEGVYEFCELDNEDYNEINNKYAHQLSAQLEFKRRTWGYQWVTLDCGNFIELTKTESFDLIINFNNSQLFKSKIYPLLRIL